MNGMRSIEAMYALDKRELEEIMGNDKVKVSELTGAALDWAVAKCEGVERTWGRSRLKPYEYYKGHAYSSDWAQGGPIIERERIGIEPWGAGMQWLAQTYNKAGRVLFRQYGLTPLIAAMRCYVASKLGSEIEIPEELK